MDVNTKLERLLKGETIKEDIRSIILHDVKKDIMTQDMCGKIFSSEKFETHYSNYLSKLYYNEADSNLKNMLKYVTIIKYKVAFDCDTSVFASKIIEKVYNVEKYGTSGRHFIKSGAIFESDTMNSFNTIFMYYLRTILQEEEKDLFKEYTNKYECDKSEFWRSLYILDEIDNIKKRIIKKYENGNKENIHEKIFEQLEIFASLTHSIGNFALVPFRFNSYRGMSSKYNDYWYKSYFDSIENDNLVNEILQKFMALKEQDIIYESVIGYRNLKKEFDAPIEIEGKINFDIKKCDESPTLDTYTNVLNILVYMNISILKRAVNICYKFTNKTISGFKEEFNFDIDKFYVENVQNYIEKIKKFVKR